MIVSWAYYMMSDNMGSGIHSAKRNSIKDRRQHELKRPEWVESNRIKTNAPSQTLDINYLQDLISRSEDVTQKKEDFRSHVDKKHVDKNPDVRAIDEIRIVGSKMRDILKDVLGKLEVYMRTIDDYMSDLVKNLHTNLKNLKEKAISEGKIVKEKAISGGKHSAERLLNFLQKNGINWAETISEYKDVLSKFKLGYKNFDVRQTCLSLVKLLVMLSTILPIISAKGVKIIVVKSIRSTLKGLNTLWVITPRTMISIRWDLKQIIQDINDLKVVDDDETDKLNIIKNHLQPIMDDSVPNTDYIQKVLNAISELGYLREHEKIDNDEITNIQNKLVILLQSFYRKYPNDSQSPAEPKEKDDVTKFKATLEVLNPSTLLKRVNERLNEIKNNNDLLNAIKDQNQKNKCISALKKALSEDNINIKYKTLSDILQDIKDFKDTRISLELQEILGYIQDTFSLEKTLKENEMWISLIKHKESVLEKIGTEKTKLDIKKVFDGLKNLIDSIDARCLKAADKCDTKITKYLNLISALSDTLEKKTVVVNLHEIKDQDTRISKVAKDIVQLSLELSQTSSSKEDPNTSGIIDNMSGTIIEDIKSGIVSSSSSSKEDPNTSKIIDNMSGTIIEGIIGGIRNGQDQTQNGGGVRAARPQDGQGVQRGPGGVGWGVGRRSSSSSSKELCIHEEWDCQLNIDEAVKAYLQLKGKSNTEVNDADARALFEQCCPNNKDISQIIVDISKVIMDKITREVDFNKLRGGEKMSLLSDMTKLKGVLSMTLTSDRVSVK